jgi:uncharacterized protein YwgA
MLTNHAKLMQFFSIAQEVTGRKKLQKMIYILKKCNIPFEEKYAFHVYGPYSEELTLRVEELCNLTFIDEVKEDKGNYYQYHYHITDQGKYFLEQFGLNMPDMAGKIEQLKASSARFLELVATMLYFDTLTRPEVEAKIHQVKPKQKYSDKEMAEAWLFIDDVTATD